MGISHCADQASDWNQQGQFKGFHDGTLVRKSRKTLARPVAPGEIYNDPWSIVSYAGLIPGIPAGAGKLGKYADEAAEFSKPVLARVDDVAGAGKLRARLGDPPSHFKKPHAHHDLPQAQRFRQHWERVGLDIEDPSYGRWVEGGPAGNHQKWSAAFNREWDAFFLRFPEASREQILDYMNILRNDPRFQ